MKYSDNLPIVIKFLKDKIKHVVTVLANAINFFRSSGLNERQFKIYFKTTCNSKFINLLLEVSMKVNCISRA